MNKILTIFAFVQFFSVTANAEDALQWQDWSDDLFEQAQRQNKFVILDLEAVWCHWCHVMEETTYKDKKVVALLKKKYITVRVDQDANPDLATRYGDYGWPATIVFAADGSEIIKRRGYIPPIAMASVLQAIIDDPSPGPSIIAKVNIKPANQAGLTEKQRKHLLDNFFTFYDAENGSWGFIHKFLQSDTTEYALSQAKLGNKLYEVMIKHTLNAALSLIDTEWGGVYQYSDQLDWQSPHFEKIMLQQTTNLRIYSLAHRLWHKKTYQFAADAVYNYLTQFLLAPDGGFYTSQDADLNHEVDGHDFFKLDDKKRRAMGMPRIDKNRYAKDNGWVISALTTYANSFTDEAALALAEKTAEWVIDNLEKNNGGFIHGAQHQKSYFLTDSQAMAQAFIDLYQATGNKKWLEKSMATLNFIKKSFQDEKGGFNNGATKLLAMGVFKEKVVRNEDQIAMARTANLAFHYTGKKQYKEMAEHAMKYLSSDSLLNSRVFIPGILLADDEINNEPLHITIVGSKASSLAQILHKKARQYPAAYLRIDWWDKSEGKLINDDVSYPQLKKAAAFACSSNTCSLPVFEPEELFEAVDRLLLPVN